VSARDPAETEAIVRAALAEVLGLSADRAAALTADTPLFGALPELDSMAVANVLAELEDRLNLTVDPEDVDGGIFDSFGTLTRFAVQRTA